MFILTDRVKITVQYVQSTASITHITYGTSVCAVVYSEHLLGRLADVTLSGVTGVASVILDVLVVIVVAEVVEPVTATDVSSVTPLPKKITSSGDKRAKELVCLLLRECGMQYTNCILSDC